MPEVPEVPTRAQNPDAPAVIVRSDDELIEKLEVMRAAQREFANFTQEQVDKIFAAAATAANKARIPLAQMAVEETGMGVMEDKVIKNHYAAEYIYNKYKNTKTCGVIEEDKAFGLTKIAEPIGVVAAVCAGDANRVVVADGSEIAPDVVLPGLGPAHGFLPAVASQEIARSEPM